MKIVHLIWSLTFGGIETMLVNIANAQAHLDIDVHIVILNKLYEDSLLNKIDKKVNVHFIDRKPGSSSILFVFRLNSLLNLISPDIIHLHLSKFYNLIWNKKLKRATCVTLHDIPRGSVRRNDKRLRIFPLLALCDSGNVVLIDKIPMVFSISEAVKQDLLQRYGVNSIVVNNGIMTNKFVTRPLSKNTESQVSVVMVSRLNHEKKGQDLLIKAASILNGKIRVTFIGDGDSREYLEKYTKELKADEYVRFLGTKTQEYIAEHLNEYDLFVQPSRYEGFGLTVAEAMAAKVPVLVSSGQGPAEVTCGDKYGWIFQNSDADELAKAIDYIISNYDEALAKAEKAYKYVCDTYDVSVTAKSYLEHYKTLCNR